MVLGQDVFLRDKPRLLLARGHELTEPIIEQFRRYHAAFGVKEPIKVVLPIEHV